MKTFRTRREAPDLLDSEQLGAADRSPRAEGSPAPGLEGTVRDYSAGLGASEVQLRALDQALVQFRAAVASRQESDVHAVASQGTSGSGGSLPHLQAIQRSFGRHDVSGVNAHTGARANAATGAMGATAYATGNDVVLSDRGSDLHTVAHEAAHVVQQRAGVALKGGVGEVGDTYERHADAVADKVVAGESAEALLDEYAITGAAAPVQRAVQREALSEQEHNDALVDMMRGSEKAPVEDGPISAQEANDWLASRVKRHPDAPKDKEADRSSEEEVGAKQTLPDAYFREWIRFNRAMHQAWLLSPSSAMRGPASKPDLTQFHAAFIAAGFTPGERNYIYWEWSNGRNCSGGAEKFRDEADRLIKARKKLNPGPGPYTAPWTGRQGSPGAGTRRGGNSNPRGLKE